jgi:GAF domain-containing protein/HAMP domain-containing protein
MNRLTSLYRVLPGRTKRVFWIVTAIGSVLAGFSLTLIGSLLSAHALLDLIATSMPFVLSFIAIISAISILYNRVQFGAWLFFISTIIIMLIAPFIQEGFAFPAAVLVLIVTILIPLQVASGRNTTIATVSGFLVAAAIIAVDTFWTGKRAGINLEDLQNARIGTIGLAIILFISIFALYQSFYLRTKLLLLTLGASLLSVIAVAGAAGFYIEAALSQNSQANLLTAAKHTAESIDAYLGFNVELIQTEASLPAFSRYLSSGGTTRQGLAEVQRTMQNLAQRDSRNISSYALLDSNGITVWDTRADGLARNQAGQDYFTIPFGTGRTYISPVHFSPVPPGNVFYFGAPVRDPDTGTILGVLRMEIRISILEDIVRTKNDAAGKGSYAIILDEYNLILANPVQPQHISRSPASLNLAQMNFLKSQNRLPASASASEISLNMAEFSKGLNNINTTPLFDSNDIAFNETVQGAAQYLSRQPWKIAYVQPKAVALAPVQQQTRAITAAALITSLILGIATLFVSRTITDPIAQLTRAAEEISGGNLDVRANVVTQDEFGALASTINDMSEQLKQTLAGLETTIAERTADLEQRGQELAQRSNDLELANQRSERRASQLLAVSTVSNAIATVQNLDELLPLITKTISQQFGFYHIGMFLNDASNQYAVLRAANSEGGQRMLLRGHRLRIGEIGIVGNVASTGRPRIALDTDADAVFFNNPDLPDTRSEMSLPLRSGPIVIGVLDVQSMEPNAFTEEEVEILGVLAGQVSIAIRNAQLFEEIQRSASELQILLQQDAREQWQRVIHNQKRAGYYYDGSALVPLNKPAEKDDAVVLIPITVRGQTIGNLGIRAPAGHKLKPDELDIVKAVGERLAISAENARLLEDSQLRAAKERTIGKISERIGSSANLDSVFRALMEELGRVLPESEILIQFTQDND